MSRKIDTTGTEDKKSETKLDLQEAQAIIESLLFVSDRPLPASKLESLVEGLDRPMLYECIQSIRNRLDGSHSPIEVREVGGGFQLATRPKYAPWIRKLHGVKEESALSKAALETLAVIAYKQPITRAEIEAIRGVNVTGLLKTLLERRLIKIAGHANAVGKPMLYRTTPEFLVYFGLKNIQDLPSMDELKEML